MSTENPRWYTNGNAREYISGDVGIKKILQGGVEKHQALEADGRFDNFKGKRGLAFIKAFLQDPLFAQLYEQAQAEAISTTKDDIDFQRHLRGAMFERMAYVHLSTRESEEIPIWGEDVLKISRLVYPNALEIDDGLGHVGQQGIYVPDGFLVSAKSSNITGIVESKLGTWFRDRKNNQIAGMFTMMGHIQAFTENPKLYVISPLYFNNSEQNSSGVRIHSIEVPVLLATFMDEFMPYVYFQHQGESGKTLAQTREEWKQTPIGQQTAIGEPAIYRAGGL